MISSDAEKLSIMFWASFNGCGSNLWWISITTINLIWLSNFFCLVRKIIIVRKLLYLPLIKLFGLFLHCFQSCNTKQDEFAPQPTRCSSCRNFELPILYKPNNSFATQKSSLPFRLLALQFNGLKNFALWGNRSATHLNEACRVNWFLFLRGSAIRCCFKVKVAVCGHI